MLQANNQITKIDFPFYFIVVASTTIDNTLSLLHFHIVDQTLKNLRKIFLWLQNNFPLTTCTCGHLQATKHSLSTSNRVFFTLKIQSPNIHPFFIPSRADWREQYILSSPINLDLLLGLHHMQLSLCSDMFWWTHEILVFQLLCDVHIISLLSGF